MTQQRTIRINGDPLSEAEMTEPVLYRCLHCGEQMPGQMYAEHMDSHRAFREERIRAEAHAAGRAAGRAAGLREAGESGWLVELGSDPPRWWDGRSRLFTSDAFDAIRFARAEDAQRAIAWLVEKGVHEGCKAVQHWFAPSPAPPPDLAAIEQDDEPGATWRGIIEREARQALAREIGGWIKQEQAWWERTAGMETRHNPQGDLLAWRNSLGSLAGRLAAAVAPSISASTEAHAVQLAGLDAGSEGEKGGRE